MKRLLSNCKHTKKFSDIFDNYCVLAELTLPDRLKEDFKSGNKKFPIVNNTDDIEEFLDHYSNETVQSTFADAFKNVGRNDP